jgi:glycosyltransferase involved in cell wall biosynthesis
MTTTTLIVFSHLRWGFVYQRPQHLLTRLSQRYRIVYVEEPVHSDAPPRLECIVKSPTLQVLVPHTPIAAPGFHDDQLAVMQSLLAAWLRRERIRDYAAWLYTPMALPLVAPLRPRAVIYDCMDELSAFDHAPRQLQQRESALFRRADLVLTGGPSLYEAKKHRHANVHCLPSSVDSRHYAPQSLDPTSPQHRDVQAIQGAADGPRLGFFGVIDERLDTQLVGAIARAHPQWQIVMVGPVVKIDPASLPRGTNIVWAGMQPYERLPYFVASWDVCLLPFAINRATKFISPTKTLEYFAGERPVVSTPVPDVVALYGEALDIGSGEDFIRACEASLARSGVEREARLHAMRRVVERSSWDVTAMRIDSLIRAALNAGDGVAAASARAGRADGTAGVASAAGAAATHASGDVEALPAIRALGF